MKDAEVKPRAKIGRPLSFDRERALEQAMLLFWRHGYESTSLRDLTAALGVTPPSIYAAFGDKKQLFLETVRHYVSGPITSESIIRKAPSARDAAKNLLMASAFAFTGDKTPPGCLLASSAISCSVAAADVQSALSNIRRAIESRLAERIVSAVADGELAESTNSRALAAYVMAVIQGMSTLARDGASREKLVGVVKTALLSWPKKKGSVRRKVWPGGGKAGPTFCSRQR